MDRSATSPHRWLPSVARTVVTLALLASAARLYGDDAEQAASVKEKPKRDWGPEQAVGPPDTPRAGDIPTAWASKTPDGQQEWLDLTYQQPVVPSVVLIYETYNPGAVFQVSVFRDGAEVKVWSGDDPTTTDKRKGVSAIPLHLEEKVSRVKIYLDSPRVSGWNEIDAVGLRDTDGKTHWAIRATASTTYAERN